MAKGFLIAFIARSGSSTLMFDLGKHNNIKMRGEVFGAARLPQDIEQNDDNRVVFLRKYWSEYRIGNSPGHVPLTARGFKLQFNPKRRQFDAPRRLARVIRDYDAAVICLRRRNLVKHAVSALRARALEQVSQEVTGVRDAHIRPDAADKVRAFAEEATFVDIRELKAMVNSINASIQYMGIFLQEFDHVTEISYEDYLADRQVVLNAIAASAGVAPFDEPPPPTLTKITSDNLAASVKNYDEVKAFAGELGYSV